MADSADEDRWSQLAADLGLNAPTPRQTDVEAPESGQRAPNRRRRPRRDRGASSEPAEGGAEIIDPGETLEPTGDSLLDRPKKRRRRRGRKSSDDRTDDKSATVDSSATTAIEEDDELAELVSVADLPSWQELIDGLHRP